MIILFKLSMTVAETFVATAVRVAKTGDKVITVAMGKFYPVDNW